MEEEKARAWVQQQVGRARLMLYILSSSLFDFAFFFPTSSLPLISVYNSRLFAVCSNTSVIAEKNKNVQIFGIGCINKKIKYENTTPLFDFSFFRYFFSFSRLKATREFVSAAHLAIMQKQTLLPLADKAVRFFFLYIPCCFTLFWCNNLC